MVGALHIGVLALQGAFREHRLALESCGAKVTEIRRRPGDSACAGLENFDGIVLPGGESTVMGRLLEEEGLLEPLRDCARMGMPVYGSCAGLILMCREVEDADGSPMKQPVLGILDARVRRNAFGRQTESFETRLDVAGAAGDMEAVFIRAPLIVSHGPDVEVLSLVDGPLGRSPAAVRQGNLLATSFHPELTADRRIHSFFLNLCLDGRKGAGSI